MNDCCTNAPEGIKSTIDLMTEMASETQDILKRTMQVLVPKDEKDCPPIPRNSGLVSDIEALKLRMSDIHDTALMVLRTIGS